MFLTLSQKDMFAETNLGVGGSRFRAGLSSIDPLGEAPPQSDNNSVKSHRDFADLDLLPSDKKTETD